MAPLTAEERGNLRDSEFAVPSKRVLPLHDAEHARLAWDMLDRTHGLDDYEREEARHRILRALHRHGVKFGGNVQEAGSVIAGVAEAQLLDEAGHVVEVTIARPGVSHNGYHYSESVLREATPLWEGAPAFLDHPTSIDLTRAGGRSLRDLVGVYEGARYEPGRGIRARLRLNGNDQGVFATVREAIEARAAGRAAPPIGISADWKLLRSPAKPGPDGRARYQVHAITAVNSGDLVVRPSAGGSFDRVLEATRAEGFDYASLDLFGAGGSMDPILAGQNAGGSSTQTAPSAPSGVQNAGSTVVQPSAAPSGTLAVVRESAAAVGAAVESGAVAASAGGAVPSEVARLVDQATLPLRQQLAASVLESRLAAANLPPAAVAHLRGQFAGRVFEAGEVDAAVGQLRGLLGDVFGQSAIRGVGSRLDAGVAQGVTPAEKIQAAFDRLFGLEVAPHLASVPRLTGIREGYVLLTGDKWFTGQYHYDEAIAREANEVTTSTVANVVLNSMTKRLTKDYQAQPKWWAPIVVKVPVTDMKTQNRILLNDFASLSTVSEDAAYSNLAWGDNKETYTPTKRGNLVVVTLETFLNDDLHAIMRIPTKVAHAATVTINEFVSALFTVNSGAGPAMADTHDVFDATNHQGNTSTSTSYDLSSAALQAAMIVLEKMQNSAGKRIGVRGRYLLVPPDLRWTAAVITQSQYATGTANNDVNPLQGAVIPVVVPQFTSAINWYLLADPAQIETIELGFLNGREEPELLVQDNPTQGSVFTNDAISYKVRHIYGGGWLDYRGAFGALPTS